MTTLLGIDIAKDSFAFHELGSHDVKSAEYLPNHTAGFEQLAQRYQDVEVCLGVEATSTYHLNLAFFALERGWAVYVFNPAKVLHFIQGGPSSHKSDSHDAWAVARYLQVYGQDYRPLTRQPEAFENLKWMMRRREQLVDHRTVERNRLHALPDAQVEVRQDLEQHIEWLTHQIQTLDGMCARACKASAELQGQLERLVEIPAVGPIVSRTLVGELGDLRQYDRAKELGQIVGLVPLRRSSGTSVSTPGRLKRGGNVRVRRVLYMAAMSARNSKEWEPWIERRARNKTGKRLLIAIMDKILRLAYGVLKHNTPFNAELAFGS